MRLIEYHSTLPSTNDRVKELMRQHHPPLPCLVVAQTQSAGRGRGNKTWWSGHGALLMSLGFMLLPAILPRGISSPDALSRSDLPALSAKSADAVIAVIRRHLPEAQHLLTRHPPNDVYVDGKKICGILLESPSPQYGIIGIGLNVNNRLQDIPPELQEELTSRSITSMVELLGKPSRIPALIDEIITQLGVAHAVLQ
ncbi:MAG: biotin--[acetyl-CoA-carboxylase] ligase family protein [Planctomycetaceae bacterium]|jgi:BirA family biotin operon repressor/biotin-[acetyl-CoA-carboxylase] ligase|nr:biotin--[acetyl-CoA-carboxylase] ligase family protein [Planctomycetaceae bacterium]